MAPKNPKPKIPNPKHKPLNGGVNTTAVLEVLMDALEDSSHAALGVGCWELGSLRLGVQCRG